MNLPNQITVGRLFLAGVLFVLLEVLCRGAAEGLVWYLAFGVYLVTVLSDGLDGYLARSRDEITAFGRITDPLADKIVIAGVLVLTQTLPATRALVPSWIVLVVIAREFLVSGLRGYLEGQGKGFGASWEGKTKLVVQAVYCGAVLFYPGHHFAWVEWTARITLWLTLAITLYSAVSYTRAAYRMLAADREP